MTTSSRPTILVSVELDDSWGEYWATTFTRPLAAAGAHVLQLPRIDNDHDARDLLGKVDGLLLGGGADIEPRHYDSETTPLVGPPDRRRDTVELPLVRAAVEAKVPILGTCRGVQALNVALGGTLYRDLSEQHCAAAHPNGGVAGFTAIIEADLSGRPEPPAQTTHLVRTSAGTRLRAAIGEHVIVNSFHHQMVRDVAPGLRVAAVADDGVIEALESEHDAAFALGVQWEVQHGWRSDRGQFAIFEAFADAARERMLQRTDTAYSEALQ